MSPFRFLSLNRGIVEKFLRIKSGSGLAGDFHVFQTVEKSLIFHDLIFDGDQVWELICGR
jgi:hypothetical protein